MGLGMGEVILILVIALVVFGPRKLPELGKSLGQAMAQFRRASEDFKRTWEQEVELEKVRTSTSDSFTTSNYGSSSESNDPYNPYSNESETAQLPEANSDSVVDSSAQSSTITNETETATAAAAQPEKKHWI
jgi:TatA/E family protein of Tat protein translocase